MMARPYFAVKLKDRQSYYYSDETIPCILELRTERPLKDPLIRVIFKGRSSSYIGAKRIHFEKIFDIEQQIKRNDFEPKKTFEIEFSVDPMKGVDLPSFSTVEGVDGGKIEYMVEAILETSSLLGRKAKATALTEVPLIAKVNIAELHLRQPKETSITWPKVEEEISQCRLHALIRGSGWMRGKTVPVYISWKQPERYLSAKKLELSLVKQEMISSSKDRPPNMSLKLSDKPIVKVTKELRLDRDPRNEAMIMNSNFEIDIPSNITPTINGNGKTVQIDYKLCVTVFLPEMGPNYQDREVSVNLDIVIGTVHENGSFDIANEIERLSIPSRSTSTADISSGGYFMPQTQPDQIGNRGVPPPIDFATYPNIDNSDFVQRSVTHHSPTTYYPPNQIPGHPQATPPPSFQNNPPYPLNTGQTPVPPINTNFPPQTPTHAGYPPNTHPGFSPSTNHTYQDFGGIEHRSSIKYQATTPPPRTSQQLNIYPPPENFEHELPMEVGPRDEEVMKINRKIEQSVYPPFEHDADPFEMASPACYMDQFQNEYFNMGSEIQESASDENTTLSSKNSCRNNDKTQPQ